MTSFAPPEPSDAVAELCITTYMGFPPSFQPQIRSNGIPQYCILSGIVLRSHEGQLKCISLGTGSKCLPVSQLPRNGEALHDSHAEVLARRGAVRWLFEEIGRTLGVGLNSSSWIQTTAERNKFRLKEGIKVYMYVSTLPCGDASTLALASAQDPEIAKHKDGSAQRTSSVELICNRGRNGYALKGILRTKPGRSDSEPSQSMSCSDKIARWALLGMQGALLSTFLEPFYIDHLVIGEVPLGMRDVIHNECQRAFHNRLFKSELCHAPHHLAVCFTNVSFRHSLSETLVTHPSAPSPVPSAEAVSWVADSSPDFPEALVKGIKRGANPKKALSSAYRSRISKASLFELYQLVRNKCGESSSSPTTYRAAKDKALHYNSLKETLLAPTGPLAGWIVNDTRLELFEGGVKSTETL